MESPVVQATLQAVAMAAISNISAQLISNYQRGEFEMIDWIPVFKFAMFAMISTPPNFLWQQFLEAAFPAYPSPAKDTKNTKDIKDTKATKPEPPSPKLSIPNTITKVLLDQTLGASLNTLLLSTYLHTMRTAMRSAPRITNLRAAVSYYTQPSAVALHEVDYADVWDKSKGEFWGLMRAGWMFWPAVSVFNFSVVRSVEVRNLVGMVAGLFWGIFLSLVSA